jgi:hypothetical protein
LELPANIDRLLAGRGKLIDELAGSMTISEARWDGDEQTVVQINRLLPPLRSPDDDDASDNGHGKARWQLSTGKATHLYGFPAPAKALEAFHLADAKKGRRLLVRDLNAGQIAAVLAWHFEEGPREDDQHRRSRSKRRRPHLVTSMTVRHDAAGALRAEYSVMLWYLLLVVAAIDRRTVKRRRVGVLADSAIILTPDELEAFGLRRGPSRRHGGYADHDYYELST